MPCHAKVLSSSSESIGRQGPLLKPDESSVRTTRHRDGDETCHASGDVSRLE